MKCALFFSLVFLSLFARGGYFQPWDKDGSLSIKERLTEEMPFEDKLGVKAMEKVILFHQNVISPVDGPRSHFRPTSARYMLLAMRRYGFFKGAVLGFDRLMRENKEEWVYRTRVINDVEYKWDPTYGK
jgi:uncharacterized protein